MAETEEAMESRLDGSSAEEKPEAKEDPWMAELIRCREEQSLREEAEATRKRLDRARMRQARLDRVARSWAEDKESDTELKLESELMAMENRLKDSREKARAKHKAMEKAARAKHRAKEKKALEGSKAMEALDASKEEEKPKPKANEKALQGSNAMGNQLEESREKPKPIAKEKVLEGSRAKAKPKAKKKGLDGSRAKAKAPTWEEAYAMTKHLTWMSQKINDLTWKLKIERLRACLGDSELCQVLSRPEIRLVPGVRNLMEQLMACERELKQRSDLSPEIKTLGNEEQKPCHVQAMAEQLSALRLEYRRLLSEEERAPDFSGITEAYRAAEAERLRADALEEARRPGKPELETRLLEVWARFLDFDPKQGGIYYSSFIYSLPTFNHADESPIGPMRFTNRVIGRDEEIELGEAVNILSVKVACSDVGFPIQVYGTLIARDCTDYKRVYLFRRDREHCQLINSEDEALILTGPKRGLALLGDSYVEIDLKIKDHQGQDREFSKGVVEIAGIERRSLKKCEIERYSLATRLSTVKVLCAVMISAVEATVAIEVLEGEFSGLVAAHTTSFKTRLVLYDSRLADHMPANGGGAIKMMRPAVSVSWDDELIIIAKAHGGKAVAIKFTPRFSNVDKCEFPLGTAKMRLQVAWSIMSPLDSDGSGTGAVK